MGTSQSTNNFQINQEISFTLNETQHTIRAPHAISPETSLNTYLREYAELPDTKVMCREGGCGACIVSATLSHPVTHRKITFAVNSCLIPVLACHNWEINTVHGIGNSQNGYHELQTTLAKFGGSQCGYCSGGMIMNMYALSLSNSMLTMQDIENSFGGNICRCTGYRPIMDAFKSLAADADPKLVHKFPDIEDLKICPKTNEKCSGLCHVDAIENPICLDLDDDLKWYKVYTIQNILMLLQKIGNETYRFVAGNTAKGVYPIIKSPKNWIDIRNVKELLTFSINDNLILGANISLADTMELMTKVADEYENFWFLKEVVQHLDLVANVPVRNTGTLAGNLSIKHDHHEFPSDVFLLLETIGATTIIVKENGSQINKSIKDYIDYDMRKCILKQIVIPSLKKANHLFKTFKIMPRAQNAHAYVNAGFLIEHDRSFKVKSARIVYGGINPDFIHAINTEKFLKGKIIFDDDTIQRTLKVLNDEIKPDYVAPDASPDFRKNLAMNLFYKFVLSTAPRDKVNPKFQSGGTRLEHKLMKGSQFYQTDKKMYPVTEPMPKLEALQQCSGEAQYINDIPKVPGELYGAFVLAETTPLSIIKNVDVSQALSMPGVKAFVDHKDIPGTNLFTAPPVARNDEELFCSGKVLYNGQPVGVIVAETYDIANDAVKMVKITYDKTDEHPEYTIKSVIENKDEKRITNVTKVEPEKKGNDIKFVVKGEFALKGQYHFTMETQNCLCIPTDDGGYDMYAGTQWMNLSQKSAASAINIPMSKINVHVKRLGGAYGAKIVRATMVSTACIVASHKLHKPVNLALSLTANMKAIGKRFPTYAHYEAGVDANGTIQYLDSTYYQASGSSGLNEEMTFTMASFMHSGYVNDTWKLNGNVVRTDTAGNAFTRAPGASEAIALIETVMEHIAHTTGKSVVEVRQANLEKSSDNMPEFLNDALSWAEYETRRKSIDEFNRNNRWMKKGLSLALMNYRFELFAPYVVVISIFAADGTVAITHGGIECGQGINTKVAQVCAYEFNIPMEMISIKPSASIYTANTQMTGGSITSEAVCYATIQACKDILNRMAATKEKMKNPTWKELVWKAFTDEVLLSSTQMFISTSIKAYNIPGACISEVQVDILTGEHVIQRVDLLEDVGSSMNPEIDVGQIEGAFVMRIGNYTCENLVYGDEGLLLTNNTWTYKVPGAKDIPEDFRIKFRANSSNPDGVLNSKATGEPALCLAIGIPFAIRDALNSARQNSDPKKNTFIAIDGPTTVEFTLQNTLNCYTNYKLN